MTRARGINILRYAILAVIVAATLYPIVWMFLASTKTNSEVFTGAGLSPGTNRSPGVTLEPVCF
jgi:ABC-type glycerol-3-phosphate transport system permease component